MRKFILFNLLIGFAATNAIADNIVMIGYWPPSNEMLRQWSTNPAQNPGGWQGENWGGFGHNVYSFFPEFPPDGNPFNDPLGSLGAVGSPDSDFRVDYQDTSQDFWRVVQDYQPTAIITFSWGGSDDRWEIEGVEGGHGIGGSNPALDWFPDLYGAEVRPTQDSIEAGSWDAISMYRDTQLQTQLPVESILTATSTLGFGNVYVDESETSGNFLSGFLGLHGLYYNSITESNLAAGHIHVGSGLSNSEATALTEATLASVLNYVNQQSIPEPGIGILIAFGMLTTLKRRNRLSKECSYVTSS